MLRFWKEDERDASVLVAVAILSRGKHVGLVHHSEAEGKSYFLHLGWHHQLMNEQLRDSTAFVSMNLGIRIQRQIAARCRQIWRANGKDTIPYGFSTPSDVFDATTSRYLLGPTGYGLTCASFVLAVFQAQNLPLVDIKTWPKRCDDVKWQLEILAKLEDHGASVEHVSAIRKDIGLVRFRPVEVAAAATISPPSVTFDGVKAAVVTISSQLS